MNLDYVGEKPLAGNHAGNKARIDIDFILEGKYGQSIVNICQDKYTCFLEKVRWILNLDNIQMLLKIIAPKDKNIILQYPFYFNPVTKRALKRLGGKNKEILFVHDVDSLRAFGRQSLGEDLQDMNKAAVVVLHNQKMIDALQQMGLTTPVVNLELFDYLLKGELPEHNYSLGTSIAFAGNLGKSTFLKNKHFKDLQLRFNLYGPNFEKEKINWNNVCYKGSFLPNEVPYKLEGSFGLIWDGEKLDTCSGSFGQYMKYNNPHKLSLYIAAGLPVIVWEEAAIADLVKKYSIGITVKSLFDIESKIQAMDELQYEKLKKNISMLQKRVTSGDYTKHALVRCEQILEKEEF